MAKLPKHGTAQQFGHWFQARVQQALDEMMQKEPVFYQRLYDTASAATFLPKQPADFIGTGYGKGFIVEAKASMKYDHFEQPGALRALLKDHQALACRLQERAGGLGLIVFYSKQGSLEVWDGAVVRETYVTPRAQLSRKAGLLVSAPSVDDVEVVHTLKSLLTEVFQK